MARYLHEARMTPSQGALSHAHPRQVWKAPRITGPDSVVAPAPGTIGLRATLHYTVFRSVTLCTDFQTPSLERASHLTLNKVYRHG